MADTYINLFRSQSMLSQSEIKLLERLKFFSTVGLVVLLVSGTLVGSAFVFMNLRYNFVVNDIGVTKRKITLASRKEVLINAIKTRIPALEKNVDRQLPWGEILSAINQIARAPVLRTVSMNEKNELLLSVSVGSLEEIEQMLGVIAQLSTEKKVKDPQLKQLQITDEGELVATIVFIPTF